VVKGQTASGSFKPAILSNGVRTMVPTHIVPGTRVVVMTADGAYVERAHVEEVEFSYLYQDAEGFHFMNDETYDQVQMQADMVGDAAPYLQEGMKVNLAIHEGLPISIEIPQKVTLEITETEPVVKGQTASGSFKPAILSNGVRTMVPTHIVPGTRVVVMTADGAYVERAKD
jgi:elongation factor P